MKTRTNQPVTDYEGLLDEVVAQSDSAGIKIYEDIKDKDGHARFIEGDIDISEYLPAGVSKTYGKWSLSGSHLLIVLGLELANATALTNGTYIATINLPSWIKEKIVPLWGGVNINAVNFTCWADDWTSQTLRINLVKTSGNDINLYAGGALTLTANRSVRVSYDLLIDNDSGE